MKPYSALSLLTSTTYKTTNGTDINILGHLEAQNIPHAKYMHSY
jgi:hypothetical protein